jgi:hypothetical protein
MAAYQWLSFADPSRPKGSHFIGACVVVGEDFASAMAEANRLGCNPGGEVMGVDVGYEPHDPSCVGRLFLGKEGADELARLLDGPERYAGIIQKGELEERGVDVEGNISGSSCARHNPVVS